MDLYIKAESRAAEAEKQQKKAEVVAKTLEETCKQLRKQMKEQGERYRNDVTTIYVTCDKEAQRAQMEMEDALSFFGNIKRDLIERDERIVGLEKIKAQKGDLEQSYKKVNDDLELVKNEMLKYKRLQTMKDDKEKEVVDDYERKIKKMTTMHNEEVNELEQKLQYERIGVQTIKNAQNTEIRDLRKEVTDLNFKLR